MPTPARTSLDDIVQAGRDILASLMAQQFIENANRLRAQRGLPPLPAAPCQPARPL